jgi:hypothetical protein
MAKKNAYIFYIILGLSLIIFASLSLTFFKIRIIEGSQDRNADDFKVSLKINLSDKNGRVVPYPLGSYTLKTDSGKYSKTVDFSMNEVASIKTIYDVDASGNISDRIVTITPKNTGGSNNPNIGDSITKRFKLDISFNQITYKLVTFAELKAKDQLSGLGGAPEPDPTNKSGHLNFIDSDNNLVITGIGSIYDKAKKNIGDVSLDNSDMNNEKTFLIDMRNPANIDYKLKSIQIRFRTPLPLTAQVPAAPPPIDPAIIKKIPPIDPNMTTAQMLDQ